ncbi:MAG TPA: carboxypeptidase-like regulatory domain-containing protein, partial [Vicinamibacterales bacterium]|nr:carboxypeptidase-like regulatory domain-containing protein [Vicinamibacterales bacterium]
MIGMSTRWRSMGIAALAWGLVLPGTVLAQSGGIAGVVKDTSGAVLPGVTVEASSPALIERVRVVTTDSEGQYKIIDVNPGVYSVTFSLAGFASVKREGIELTTAFTATVNAELPVGAVTETISVSGATPVVDVQNVVQQSVMTHEVIDSLPTGKMLVNLATLVPGMLMNVSGGGGAAADVGGSVGERYTMFQIHGGRTDGEFRVEGLSIENFTAGSSKGSASHHINTGSIEEMTFETDNQPVERENGGPSTNIIPKDGGDRYTGSFFVAGTNSKFENSNLTPALINRGLTAVSRIDKIWDFNPSVGGPVMLHRLWFFGSARHWGTDNFVAGDYYNQIDYTKTPQSFAYVPDLSRQAVDNLTQTAETLRLTWQATPRNKFATYLHNENRCSCHDSIVSGSLIKSPEATGSENFKGPSYFASVTWSAPVTNRFMLEGGYLRLYDNRPLTPAEPTTAPDLIGVFETSANLWYRASQPGTPYVTKTTG